LIARSRLDLQRNGAGWSRAVVVMGRRFIEQRAQRAIDRIFSLSVIGRFPT
jgi:hypothetical protein